MADKVKQDIEKLYPGLLETWLKKGLEWTLPFGAGENWLTLLMMGVIKMSDVVVDDFGNTARSEGLNDSKIQGHMRNIKNGKYKPKNHPPILVEPIYINGELKVNRTGFQTSKHSHVEIKYGSYSHPEYGGANYPEGYQFPSHTIYFAGFSVEKDRAKLKVNNIE